jgi:hypothetical protein
MSKLMLTLMAGLFAMSVNGVAVAAEAAKKTCKKDAEAKEKAAKADAKAAYDKAKADAKAMKKS